MEFGALALHDMHRHFRGTADGPRSAHDAEGPVETFPGLPPFGIYAKRGYVCSKADRFAQSTFDRSEYDFSSGEPTGDREHTN